MQRQWPRTHRISQTLLESYPAPTSKAPEAWVTGSPPSSSRLSSNGVGGEHAIPDLATEPANANRPAGMELEGVYIISVAARLLEMHPQTLRKYERLGLIQPERTVGMLRLYSRQDLHKVMLIRHLMDNLGLNLAGVEFALKLVNNLEVFSNRIARSIDDAEVADSIRSEVALLCNSLSLPVPD